MKKSIQIVTKHANNKIIPSFRVKYSNENSNNKNDNSVINNDISNNIEEIKEKEEINEQKDSNDDYQIQRVSIYINKVQTISNFYRNSSLGIIVYAVNSRQSFENIEQWLKELKTNSNPNIKVFLIGHIFVFFFILILSLI